MHWAGDAVMLYYTVGFVSSVSLVNTYYVYFTSLMTTFQKFTVYFLNTNIYQVSVHVSLTLKSAYRLDT